jgi:hypothetical protein
MLNFSVTKNGKKLDPSLYTWDEETRTFSTNEDNLVLDFKTGYNYTFNTGFGCTFNTGSDCTFNTRYNCTFKTGPDCTFNTGFGCTFNTEYNCTFKTGSDCTFKTESGCTFNTGSGCTFKTGFGCTFKTGSDCVIVRRYIFEVIQPKENQKIKLNGYMVPGYTIIENKHEIVIDGKKIELSKESYENLKNQLK